MLKKKIAEKDIKFYTVNANKMAASLGLGNKISLITVMFLMALGMDGLIEIEKAATSMKTLAKITYAKQSAKVIEANMKAVDMTLEVLNSCKYNYDKEKWLIADPQNDLKVEHYGPAPTELLMEG